MGFFAWIFVGLIAGWLAEQIAGREHGLVTNLVVGVIGRAARRLRVRSAARLQLQ